MSKLMDLKLAYLETDIRQNLPEVIQNYVSFNDKVQEADKKAFINFEFKCLLERLEQIKKDGTTEVAPTDAAEPKLGHRTSVPYPAGGITKGIKVGKFEEQTLADLLEENLSNDIQDFYIFKERSSTFINTLLQVDDLQVATLEDFEKLVCSKEITKIMKALSPVTEDPETHQPSMLFFVENYLKEDDAIFINTKVRDNVKTYIHNAIICPIAAEFNYTPKIFKIENGIQPYASTLKIKSKEGVVIDELLRMQQGLGVEIALANNNVDKLFSDEFYDTNLLRYEDTKADFDEFFSKLQWFKDYIRNRMLERYYAHEVSGLIGQYAADHGVVYPATRSKPVLPSNPSQSDIDTYNTNLAKYNACEEAKGKIDSLIVSLLATEALLLEADYSAQKDFIRKFMGAFTSTLVSGDFDENFDAIYPDKRQTRIKADIEKFYNGTIIIEQGKTFENTIMYTNVKEQELYNGFRFKEVSESVSDIRDAIENIFEYFRSFNGLGEIYNSLKDYEYKCFDLHDELEAFKQLSTSEQTDSLVKAINSFKTFVGSCSSTSTDDLMPESWVNTIKEKAQLCIDRMQSILELTTPRTFILEDIYEFLIRKEADRDIVGYIITLDSDRGVIRVVKESEPN